MKILIASETYYPQINGASYFAQRLAKNLAAHGHVVGVICPGQTFSNTVTVIDGVTVYGMRSFPTPFEHNFRMSTPIIKSRAIEKVIEDFSPDVIHLQMHFFIGRLVLKIAKKRNIPIVATNHFMPENLIHYLPLYSIIGRPIIDAAWGDFARVFRKINQVTTPTRAAARLIQARFRNDIQPVSNGIDLEVFNPRNNGEYLRERYKIPMLPTFLFVGRLDKEKNVDMVIRAAAAALKTTSLQLIVAGNGAEKKPWIRLAEDLGIEKSVIFTGFVPDEDLPNLYTIADCFVIAGTAELQSIVTMEAMASGLPVLAVDAVALPELVRDGENGYLFDFGNTEQLARQMVELASDEKRRKQMGAKSLEFIAEHAIEKTVAAFERIYEAEIVATKAS